MMSRKLIASVAGVLLATGAPLLVATATTAGAAGSTPPATTHSVTAGSKANYSSAVERPSWSFSCDSASHKWSFSLNDVQVFDSTGHTWGDTQGPWSVGVFATTGAGPVPFSITAHLRQNTTNGLFEAIATGSSSSAATWCQAGSSLTVEAFSGSAQPLLLDGTLG
jgi:hypothetical protein